jgi:hypothetical protein
MALRLTIGSNPVLDHTRSSVKLSPREQSTHERLARAALARVIFVIKGTVPSKRSW